MQSALARNSFLRCSSSKSLLLLRVASQTADAAASTRSLLRTRDLRTQDLDVTRDDDETLADFDTLMGLRGDVGSHTLDAEAAARDLHGHCVDLAGIAGKIAETPAGEVADVPRLEPRVEDRVFASPREEKPSPAIPPTVPRELEDVSVVPRLLYVTPTSEMEVKSRVRIFNHSLRDFGFAVNPCSRGDW